MKIREKIILSHLMMGIVPIIIAIVSLLVFMIHRSRLEVKNNLTSALSDVVEQINRDMDWYTGYSFMFSQIVSLASDNNLIYSAQTTPIYLYRFDIKIHEFSEGTNIFRREFSEVHYAQYVTSDEYISFFWEFLSDPYFYNEFMISYPEIVSNCVVIRNINFLSDPETEKKTGLSISSFPMDQKYLKGLAREKENLIVFCEFSNNVIFSESKLNDATNLITKIQEAGLDSEKSMLIRGIENSQFYLKKDLLFEIDDQSINIGILYGYNNVNAFMSQFKEAVVITFLIVVFLALGIAYFLTSKITTPLLKLRNMVTDFEKNLKVIPSPKNQSDEVNLLQESFSQMSNSIIRYKRKLDSYNAALSQEVVIKTNDLETKVQSLTLINQFSAFTMKLETLDEQYFMQRVILSLKELLNLKYISLFSLATRNPVKMDYIVSDKNFSKKEKVKKIEKIEDVIIRRAYRYPEQYIRGPFNLTVYCSPIYFIDQLEYAIFFIGDRKYKDFITETIYTLSNLISLKIFSLRIYNEKINSEKMASLGQFASTIIHDIKNPLTVIKSGIEVLSDDDYTDEEKQDYQKVLSDELELLANMLNDILDFSKGKIQLNREDVEIDKVLEGITKLYVKPITQKGIELKTELEAGVTVSLDKDRIRRVIGNIINNAIDALEDGGTITIKCQKKIFDVLIIIEDDGPGIPPEIQDDLFKPFVTHGKKNGTGLGLSIVKKVIESHGGNINFKTEKGKGTRFFISFPI